MKKIIIASKNPVKINAVAAAFGKMFPEETFEAEGVSASSGVSDQPKGDSEIFKGALNRAENASHMADGDFWVGIEGGIDPHTITANIELDALHNLPFGVGVEEKDSSTESFSWVVVKSKDGRFGKARTGTFFLPPKVAELIKQGIELGEANDIVFNKNNSKQKNGAVGILTGDVVDRTKFYFEAVVLALIPFKNRELYPQ